MKVFILILVLTSAQVLATETESESSTTDLKKPEAQLTQTEEQLERVRLEVIKATPNRQPASWGGGGRNFR